ncbi:hypothetical protein Pelo_4529 [Pelomyxa schiedti]|nr:hypothetical protein Pelo_4529 [Pelomyxa schiedti]
MVVASLQAALIERDAKNKEWAWGGHPTQLGHVGSVLFPPLCWFFSLNPGEDGGEVGAEGRIHAALTDSSNGPSQSYRWSCSFLVVEMTAWWRTC